VTGGAHHSMALAGPTGKLFAFGRSDSSQLGIGRAGGVLAPGASEALPVPVLFPAREAGTGKPPFVTGVSCGGTFNLATTSSNQVYSWGFGEMGQLGHRPARGEETSDEPCPRLVDMSQARG
ncbi:regulator of chromosome condensation -like protein, partial [Nannochloropsis gaditana CCMP526]